MATSGEKSGPLDALDARPEGDAALRREILDLAKRLERRGFRFGNMPATAKIMLEREHLDAVSSDDLVQARDELRAFYAVIMRREQGVVGRIQELKRTRIAAVAVAFLAGAGAAYGVQQLQSGNSGEVVAQNLKTIPETPTESPPPSVFPPYSSAAPSPPSTRLFHREKLKGGDGTIRTLTDENFEKQTASGFWVVDFWAEWCEPCRGFAPNFDAVAARHGKRAQFARFNVDPDNDGSFNAWADRFSVKSIPTVLFLEDGRRVGSIAPGALTGSADAEKRTVTMFKILGY